MPKSFSLRATIFLLSMLVGSAVGTMVLQLLLKWQGLEFAAEDGLSGLVEHARDPRGIVCALGANHLLMFTGSALLYWFLVREEAFAKYFHLEKKIDMQLAGLFVLLLFFSYPLIGATGLVTAYLELPEWLQGMSEEYSATMMGMFGRKSLSALFANLIVLSLLPAIGEELIFRGIVQKELQGIIKSPHIAILLTSIFFSAIHLQAEGFLPKLLISLILCYAYHWTKSLWYPMLLHFVNNAFMTLAMYMAGAELAEVPSTETPSVPWLSIVISLFLCALVVLTIRDKLAVIDKELRA